MPHGHPLAGQPMEIPAYGVSFLRDVMGDGVREGLLCTGRKNGKSAIIAMLRLGLARWVRCDVQDSGSARAR